MTEAAVNPTRAQFDAFKALSRDTPIQMLNLIRLKTRAEYPEDHANFGRGLSGLEAYRAYGADSAEVFSRVGGRQIWAAGPPEEAWDLAFIAEYPSAGAFLAMITDPGYREHVKHRTAAVADSRLIRLAPIEPGAGFGE